MFFSKSFEKCFFTFFKGNAEIKLAYNMGNVLHQPLHVVSAA